VAPAEPQHPIGDYALIGDCYSAALVGRDLSIDWCCLPRFDSGSTFARLLDAQRGGFCAILPAGRAHWHASRQYVEDTLVLQTTLQGSPGEAQVHDLFVAPRDDAPPWSRRLLRCIEVKRGAITFELRIQPRFDYGEVRPWIRRHSHHVHSATGGDDGLVVVTEAELGEDPAHELSGRIHLSAGQRVHLSLDYMPPELIADDPPAPDPGALDDDLEYTIGWWREWCATLSLTAPHHRGARRSALTLKAMTYRPTGAIVAAPTTSLPEVPGGVRNWDYRYAWIRDSSFSSRAFAEVGCEREADAFRAFVLRSSAGHVEDLQIMYGVGGERRLDLRQLDMAVRARCRWAIRPPDSVSSTRSASSST
jgi:GH15 family glucan-1,4-alpha-glucosidase